MGPPPRAIEGLQVLRAVAALLVVLHHALGNSYAVDYFGLHLFEVGRIGVDMFFVLSGFIIAFASERDRSPAAFAKKRIARVVPLYWSLTLFIFLAAQFVPFLIGEGENTLGPLLRSLLFIPYFNADGTMSPIVGLGWTLNFEMMFYAIFAAALVVAPGRRIVFALCALVALALMGALFTVPGAPLEFYTRDVILEFGFGLLLYALFAHRGASFARVQRLWPLALVVLAAVPLLPFTLPRFLALGVPSALLVAPFVSLRVARLPRGSAFVRLGDASYALYLTHLYIVGTTFWVVRARIPASLFSVIGMVLLVTAGSVIAALLIHTLYEKPILNYLRRTWVRKDGDFRWRRPSLARS